MTDSFGASPVPPPPPPGATPIQVGKPRPRWNSIDTWPVLIFALLTISSLFVEVETDDDSGSLSDTELIGLGFFVAVAVQQLIQFGWPWIVSKWKGLGLVDDWRFRFNWREDLKLGFGVGVLCYVVATVVSLVTSALVGLGDDDNPSNTSIITDNEGSAWLIVAILVVVVGAPLTEELLFRGLVLRAFEKDFGTVVAVIGSTILFALPHVVPGATWGETIVLWASIGAIGLVFALATVRYDRLGPAIIGHFLFNLTGTLLSLFV